MYRLSTIIRHRSRGSHRIDILRRRIIHSDAFPASAMHFDVYFLLLTHNTRYLKYAFIIVFIKIIIL